MPRIRDSRWGRRVGGWPSALVVAVSYLLLLALRLLLPRSTGEIAAATVGVLVLAYCLLRASRRGDVLSTWVAPSAAAAIAHDITGVSRWLVGPPLMLLAVAVLVAEDREERRVPAQPA
jgi:hypothetical protein